MVGNRIKEFRELADITQAELARSVEMAQSNLSALESGKVMPSPKARRSLSRALRVPQKKLFPSESRR